MKWWDRLKQLQRHRWLPFFLPVIGTLLYIAIVILLVPSEFDDKSEADAADSEKPALGVTRPKTTRAVRIKHPGTANSAGAASAVLNTP